MLVKYNGKRKMFVYGGYDFSTGVAEVPDNEALAMIVESNGTFSREGFAPVVRIKPEPMVEKEESKKPVVKKPVAKKPVAKKS